MSSSDSSGEDKKKKVATKKGGKAGKQDYQIKPSSGGASLDTSTWPLLLKVKKKPHINLFISIEL
jgi:hypothetical protein